MIILALSVALLAKRIKSIKKKKQALHTKIDIFYASSNGEPFSLTC